MFTLLKKLFLLFFITFALTTEVDARSFNLVNNCGFPVWFGFVSGSGSTSPAPADNNYLLTANGGTNVVTIPSAWSGVISGRTNCVNGVCETADCGGSGTGACTHGFMQPATQAEFTVRSTGTDFYDVEDINGFHLPISITPNVTAEASKPYFCGSPGAVTPSAGLGACSWQFSPPLDEYQWVQKGGAACSSNSDCAAGTRCGLSFNPGKTPLLQKTCGKILGYWTANQICGVQRNYGSPFYCSQSLPSPQNNLTWWNLYACVSVGSCYSTGAGNDCCGCVNWDKIGIPVPPGPITKQCNNSNPNWVNGVQPTLTWLKQACPTLYTYPYDDMSSTFTCEKMVGGQNQVDYTITFCPKATSTNQCLAPTNITSIVSSDKKSVTLSWQEPSNSLPISHYQASNSQNVVIWKGTDNTQKSFTDNTLPGTDGTYSYYLASNCSGQLSPPQKHDVVISSPTTGFNYYITVGYPFLKVLINNSIPCPDANGNPSCLVSNQAAGSNMLITGQAPHVCSLAIQSNGSVIVNPNSNSCFINSKPATPTMAGKISLPSRF